MTENRLSLQNLITVFEGVPDFRINRHKKYTLGEILFLTLSAVVSGFTEWEEIADFGNEKLAWLREFYTYENGTPSHDTINRVISHLDNRAFEERFIRWATQDIKLPDGTVINVDGKKLRGSATKKEQQTPHSEGGKSAVHLVQAWCNELQLCLGQYKTEDKSNEITAIPALLEWLDLSGCIITIDAMGCQKAIAQQVISQGADYVLGLKGNQSKLHEAVKGLFEAAGTINEQELGQQAGLEHIQEQSGRGHGRRSAELTPKPGKTDMSRVASLLAGRRSTHGMGRASISGGNNGLPLRDGHWPVQFGKALLYQQFENWSYRV